MTVSTLSVVPEATASGTAPCAKPDNHCTAPAWWHRSPHLHEQAIARAARPDYEAWLSHVKPASACVRPVRLAGTMLTVQPAGAARVGTSAIEAQTYRVLSAANTADMPDGVIYKPCGNRRESACPACSKRYQNDAYQIIRAGLVGGKGVSEDVARHPQVFPTLTAPSFGEVHTRAVKRHTCARRRDCDCRPEPCHARRDFTVCEHGQRMVCFARHPADDPRLGTPLCLDCYDHDAQAVWNVMAGELWRRTTIAAKRYIARLARQRGIPDVARVSESGRTVMVPPVRLEFDKVAEMQRRAVVHLHVTLRLDGVDPADPDTIVAPPPGITAQDLIDAIDHAAATVGFTTDPHPTKPEGWHIGWGDQTLTKVINSGADGDVTDTEVAAYLAKYATKSTEITGHVSGRLTADTIDLYADACGSHTERLIAACWRLSRARWTCPTCHQRSTRQPCPTCTARGREALEAVPEVSPYRRLQRWAHMLGFGGHFLTKSRRYSITFGQLRAARVVFRRTVETAGPPTDTPAESPTALVVNFLQFVGAGWRTPADAMLANTSAQMAREHHDAARQYLTTRAA